jgi:hypothetical protein
LTSDLSVRPFRKTDRGEGLKSYDSIDDMFKAPGILWMLIYKLEPGVVIFERTGSHSDLVVALEEKGGLRTSPAGFPRVMPLFA